MARNCSTYLIKFADFPQAYYILFGLANTSRRTMQNRLENTDKLKLLDIMGVDLF